jgi:hypothetical protein
MALRATWRFSHHFNNMSGALTPARPPLSFAKLRELSYFPVGVLFNVRDTLIRHIERQVGKGVDWQYESFTSGILH